MSRSLLKYWPILHNFDKEFMAKIKMVMVYGDNVRKAALIVLKDDSVYDVRADDRTISDKSFNSLWKPAKVHELSNKGIKDFAWGRLYGIAALTDKGEVYYWKRIEIQAFQTREAARLIGGYFYEKSIVQISCSEDRLFALTKDGQVLRHWDSFTHNILHGLCPTMGWIGLPKYIACTGSSHVMIVNTCGEVQICGGRLTGHSEMCEDKSCQFYHPYRKALSKSIIVKVACGYSHTLVLSENGDVYTWGENSYGQLGIGNTSDTSVDLQQVTSTEMGKVADIAAIPSGHMSGALTCTGKVFMWGLSRGQTYYQPTLTPFSTLREVFAAYAHPNVMYSPLILRDEEKEENEDGETDVIDSLRNVFDDPSNSDFAIKVEGKTIHVHKSVLGIRSVYFQTMFKEQWTENNQSTFEHNDFPYDVYKSFLKYLYTGEIDVQDEELMELLALANAYCERQLKRRCAQKLGKDIEVSNVLHLYDIAITHGSTELENLCMEFASDHMSLIVQSPQFATLSSERGREFVIKAAAKGAFH